MNNALYTFFEYIDISSNVYWDFPLKYLKISSVLPAIVVTKKDFQFTQKVTA